MRLCPGCKQLFPLNEYLTRKGAHAASVGRLGQPYGYCRPCRRTRRDGDPDKFFISLIAAANKRRGTTMKAADLRDIWLKQEKRCALTGVEMTFIHGQGIVWSNVSIDRIDNSKGYELGNVRLVTCAINLARNAMNDAQFMALVRCYIHHQNPMRAKTKLTFANKL
jgi:hypothetical protein